MLEVSFSVEKGLLRVLVPVIFDNSLYFFHIFVKASTEVGSYEIL